LPSIPLKVNLDSIDEEITERFIFQVSKGFMVLGKFLQTGMKGGVSWRLSLNTLGFLDRSTIGEMHHQPHGGFQGFFQVVIVRRNGKGFPYRLEGFPNSVVQQLG